MRHGEAEAPISSDIDRNLSRMGRTQTYEAGKFLADSVESLPVICSIATRTRESLEQIEALWKPQEVIYTDRLYGHRYFDILDLILECAFNEVLIIGHNPGVSELVSYFTDQSIYMTPAEIFVISFEITDLNALSKGLSTIDAHFVPDRS